jgi:hypothetical protein
VCHNPFISPHVPLGFFKLVPLSFKILFFNEQVLDELLFVNKCGFRVNDLLLVFDNEVAKVSSLRGEFSNLGLLVGVELGE